MMMMMMLMMMMMMSKTGAGLWQVKYFCLISEDTMEDTKDSNDWGGESERAGEWYVLTRWMGDRQDKTAPIYMPYRSASQRGCGGVVVVAAAW